MELMAYNNPSKEVIIKGAVTIIDQNINLGEIVEIVGFGNSTINERPVSQAIGAILVGKDNVLTLLGIAMSHRIGEIAMSILQECMAQLIHTHHFREHHLLK